MTDARAREDQAAETVRRERRKPPVRPWLVATIALTITAALYVPALSAPFVWDDAALIFDDPMVTEVRAPQRYLFSPFWAQGAELRSSRDFYRPLVTFSFALDHAAHDHNAAGYHLTNVAAHLVACALLFALLRRASASPFLAGVLTLAWGAAPRLAECVAWISGRTDVFAATFSFAALLAWRIDSPRRRWTAAALVLLGLLAKEVAIAAWLALVVDCFLARRPKAAAPLGVVVATYAALRFAALHGRPPAYMAVFSPVERALLAVEAAGRYAWMLLDPWQPRTQIGLSEGARSVPFVALGIGVFVAMTAIAFAMWRRGALAGLEQAQRRRAVLVPLVVLLVGIGLVLQIIPLPVNVVAADRFLYLPAGALTILIAPLLERALVRHPWVWAPVVFVAATITAVAPNRILDWCDDARLWTKAVRTSPAADGLPHNALGNVYFRVAEYERALAEYEACLAADRELPQFTSRASTELANIANAQAKLGRYHDSLRRREQLVAQLPQVPRYHLDLASDSLRLLDFSRARAEIAVALELLPGWDEALDAQHRVDELEPEARALDGADAGAPGVAARRARFLSRLGRRPEALRAWGAVLADPSARPDDTFDAAVYFAREAPIDDARRAVERATHALPEARTEPLRVAFLARAGEIEHLHEAEAGS